jgi:tagatose 1,6-diphosphate aldolase
MPQKQITRGKFDGINACADAKGVIAALAMDQRGSLEKAITAGKGSPATAAEMSEFKRLVTDVLSPHASSVLLDVEYGLDASKQRPAGIGLLLAYELSGYDSASRMPDLMPEWSVRQLKAAGAEAVKVVMQYDPDDADSASRKHVFVERVGAECVANDIAFFFEPVTYGKAIGDEKGVEYAKAKPEKVTKTMMEFSKPEYYIDILKVEVPVNMRFVAGSKGNTDSAYVYTRAEAAQAFRDAAAVSKLPFIYLSAGVTDEVFRESLELAGEAGTPFSGVLCGRATWQGGIMDFVRGGGAAFRAWLETQGVENIKALNAILAKHARPWWDFYGGNSNIQVIG